MSNHDSFKYRSKVVDRLFKLENMLKSAQFEFKCNRAEHLCAATAVDARGIRAVFAFVSRFYREVHWEGCSVAI